MMCVKYLAHSSISGWGGSSPPSNISHAVRQKFEDGVLCPKCRNPSMQCPICWYDPASESPPALSTALSDGHDCDHLTRPPLSASHRSHQATVLGINYKYFCIKKHITEKEIRMPRSGPVTPAICL